VGNSYLFKNGSLKVLGEMKRGEILSKSVKKARGFRQNNKVVLSRGKRYLGTVLERILLSEKRDARKPREVL